MKRCIKKSFFLPVFLCSSLFAFAEGQTVQQDFLQNPEYSRLSELLTGYLSNDLDLKKAVLTAQSKALSLKSTEIQNGIDVSISTGNISVTTDVSGKSTVTASPSLSVDFPMVSDASVSVSIPYTVEDGSSYVSAGSVAGTVGIISSSAKEREVELLKAERSYTEAKRSVRECALTAEKEFYENLKKLYNYAISIHTAKNDLYDDSLDLRVLETEGYSKTSAKYRQALLKVKSDERDVQEQQRLLEKETAVFAMKCGKEFSRTSESFDEKREKGEEGSDYNQEAAGEAAYRAAIEFLPDAIPAVKEERIFDYSEDDYTSVESSNWDKTIAELERKADTAFSMSATGEYKFNSAQSAYDDAGAKLNFDWKGLSASAGFYVPTGNNLLPQNENSSVTKNDKPYFQFGVSLSPNEWRLWKIQKEQDKLDEQTEDIAIKAARDDYETDVLDKVSTFHDIKWSENSYADQLDMYTQLAADMEKWYSQGLVTESDLNDAVNNREKARLNVMLNAIDLLIYNDEVKLLFNTEDSE